jgi:Ca2+-binding EF-hand superfamily protein
LQVIAENLSEEEIAGLKEMFKMMDTDNSGQINFEELKAGLQRVGANMKESEIYQLMQAVSFSCNLLGTDFTYFCQNLDTLLGLLIEAHIIPIFGRKWKHGLTFF